MLYSCNRLLSLCLLLFLFTFIISCDSPSPEPNNVEESLEEDELSSSDLKLIDALKVDSTTTINGLYLEDSTSVKEFLQKYDPTFLDLKLRPYQEQQYLSTAQGQIMLFKTRMNVVGLLLSNRQSHKYPAGTESNQPKQYGIAYSAGGKQYTVRQKPTAGTCNRNLEFHGLDCSGLIYQMSKNSYLNVLQNDVEAKNKGNVAFLSDTKVWDAAFVNSNDYNMIRMKLMRQPSLDDIMTGDIIIWRNHIGYVIPGRKVVHSSGAFDAVNQGDCEANFKKGPRINLLTSGFLAAFSGGTYNILRTEPACIEGSKLVVQANRNVMTPGSNPYSVEFSVSGGYPPYRYRVMSKGDLLHSQGSGLICNVAMYGETRRDPFKTPYNIRVTDNRGNIKDTTIYVR
jgi:hypothetical protein